MTSLTHLAGCDRIVFWRGGTNLDSFRHIWRAYHDTARKLGYNTVWIKDGDRGDLLPGDLVFAIDIWADDLPIRPGVHYVLHNLSGSHRVFSEVEPERILRLQVWTHDAVGEQWAPFRQYSREGRILFQPWGTDLLAEEFLEPVYNPQSRDVAFVGAVWSDIRGGVDLGNGTLIADLKAACGEHGLRFHHRTQISDAENIATVRDARLAPALSGEWQVAHAYLSCRAFKNVSYGALGMTNVPELQDLLGMARERGTGLLLASALGMRRAEYIERVREQQRIVGQHFTYRESLAAVGRALEEGR